MPDWAVNSSSFPSPLKFNLSFDTDTGYPKLDDCKSHTFSYYYFTKGKLYINRFIRCSSNFLEII